MPPARLVLQAPRTIACRVPGLKRILMVASVPSSMTAFNGPTFFCLTGTTAKRPGSRTERPRHRSMSSTQLSERSIRPSSSARSDRRNVANMHAAAGDTVAAAHRARRKTSVAVFTWPSRMTPAWSRSDQMGTEKGEALLACFRQDRSEAVAGCGGDS
jgi:hypothetical protein